MNESSRGKRRRPRRSPAEWADLVTGWSSSGLPAARYAEEHGVGVHSLWRWASRLRGPMDPRPRAAGREGADAASGRFLAVRVARSSDRVEGVVEARGLVEIAWPGGPLVRVRGEVSTGALAQVLRALSEVVPC